MILYPAIDLRGGKVVRLDQGRADRETLYATDPGEPALRWKAAGAQWIHVVDLDGAFDGRPSEANAAALGKIAQTGLKIELGGGIRTPEHCRSAFAMGVHRVVVGTKAAQEPGFVRDLVRDWGPERIAAGIDARGGRVAVKGWVETVDLSAIELALRMQDCGVGTLIYTDISRDGMLVGPNFEAQEAMLQAVQTRLIASGGVACLEDLRRFATIADRYPHFDGVIIGKALYENRVSLAEAVADLALRNP